MDGSSNPLAVRYRNGYREQGSAARLHWQLLGPRANLRFVWAVYRALPLLLTAFAALQLGTGRSGLSATPALVAGVCAAGLGGFLWWLGTDAGIGWAGSLRGTERDWLRNRPEIRVAAGEHLTVANLNTGALVVYPNVQIVAATKSDIVVIPVAGSATAIPRRAFKSGQEREQFIRAAQNLSSASSPPPMPGSATIALEDAPFAFGVSYDVKDLAAGLREIARDRSRIGPLVRVPMGVLACLLAIATVPWLAPVSLLPFTLIFGLGGAWCLAYPWSGPRLLNISAAMAHRSQTPQLAPRSLLVVDDRGVSLAEPAVTLEVPWKSVSRVVLQRDRLLIIAGDAFIPLPRRSFAGDQDLARLLAFVREHTDAS